MRLSVLGTRGGDEAQHLQRGAIQSQVSIAHGERVRLRVNVGTSRCWISHSGHEFRIIILS